GGRVMKIVTGLDLTKVMSGSHGTLGFLTEVTFKVAPQPEQSVTLAITGLNDGRAIEALSAALGSPFEPSGAAHLPAGLDAGQGRTLVRIEGFRDSVNHRLDALATLLGRWGTSTTIEGADSATLWADIRDAGFVTDPADHAIWRVSTTPGYGPAIAADIGSVIEGARWFYDWGGGLIWLSVPTFDDGGARAIRGALVSRAGHATLVRAPDTIRESVAPFQPPPEAEMRLTVGIKHSFDPQGVLERGRMYEGL
ncbi:MAG: glycolate oxidase subunit GlcE, partial [Alphaproteobacteria bacterium]